MTSNDDFEEDRIPNYNVAAIKDNVRSAFEAIYQEERAIAELEEAHLKEHKEERTKLWRELKADTTLPRADLKHLYGLFKRIRDAEEFEEEGAADVVRENIKTAWAALAEGETLNFLSALGVPEAAQPEAEAAE